MHGLRIVEADGSISEPIDGTPPVYDDAGEFLGQVMGLGWMLDIAPHPDYAENGWIYIHHTDRCSDCNAMSRRGGQPVSMNRLVRGRIRGGKWLDEEVIWRADPESYTNTSDLAAGGRIAFDWDDNVYISVGMKGALDFMGIQDLGLPYGKIHRVRDDGSIPENNPFLNLEGALPSIWTTATAACRGWN